MSQYWERVERQRLLIRAEQWARGVKCIHGHSCSSMWYDTTNNTRKVVDVEYNNGTINRTDCETGDSTQWFGESLVGEELIDAYTRLN
mgnify:FL=1|tara:strand:- start:3268 stop:3531 length:264 start_codon:yes stop_codon:yes gene_type:complete